MLLEVDGVPLTAAQEQQQRAKLAEIVAHPDEFSKMEAARMGDEAHARLMLDDLDKGFILENVKLEDGVWHVDFRPNPGYSPSGIEERVLHGMSGWLAIDAKDLRLVHIEGKLPTDVSTTIRCNPLVAPPKGAPGATTGFNHDRQNPWRSP